METTMIEEKTSDIETLTAFIYVGGNDLWTDSRKVAVAFGKRHSDVIRSIEEILTQVPDFFGKRNFTLSEYEVKNNLGFMVRKPVYEMTKDGFALLVMGFTGKQAMTIKIAYIEAFNRMANQIMLVRKTMMERLNNAEIIEQLDFAQASFHAKHLCRRKQSKRMNHAKIEEIKQLIQPDLFGFLGD